MTIPASVTSAELSMFRSLTRLTDVFYGGSEQDWSVLANGTSLSVRTTVHFNVTPESVFEGGFTALRQNTEGVTVQVYSADAPATAILTAYDAAGRLLSSRVITLRSGYSEETSAVTGDTFTLFLLDEDWKPLCTSITK